LINILFSSIIIDLINCGGSSDEAKELLRRLLQVVGIPQSIVVNICQDGNDNGFCESIELQTKVSINKGDGLEKVLDKVSLTADGEYFLENYDPSKKILMEIQDSEKVNYNAGKFIFTYNPETQELSILQMMIDEGYLASDDVKNIRSTATVDSFYKVLFRDFESNLNTLGDKKLSSPRAVLANMKEVADELLLNGIRDTLPQNLNTCENNQTCIDAVLSPISTEILITDEEAVVIYDDETIANKELVANKTFYSQGLDENHNSEIYKNQFNADTTTYTWEIIEGTNKGKSSTNSIIIEGNILTDNTENKIYLFLGKYDNYLLYKVNNIESKLYFDLNKLKSDIRDSTDLNPNPNLSNKVNVLWNDTSLSSVDITSKAITIREGTNEFSYIPEIQVTLDNGYSLYFKYCAILNRQVNSNENNETETTSTLCKSNDWRIILKDTSNAVLLNRGGSFSSTDDPYNGIINGSFSSNSQNFSGEFGFDNMVVSVE